MGMTRWVGVKAKARLKMMMRAMTVAILLPNDHEPIFRVL